MSKGDGTEAEMHITDDISVLQTLIYYKQFINKSLNGRGCVTGHRLGAQVNGCVVVITMIIEMIRFAQSENVWIAWRSSLHSDLLHRKRQQAYLIHFHLSWKSLSPHSWRASW